MKRSTFCEPVIGTLLWSDRNISKGEINIYTSNIVHTELKNDTLHSVWMLLHRHLTKAAVIENHLNIATIEAEDGMYNSISCSFNERRTATEA